MKLYLDYDQAELDRQYTQTVWAANADEIIGWYGAESAAARARLAHRAGVRYGDSEAETLDLFPTDRPNAPVHVFVHGGAWKILTRSESSFAAGTFVRAGAHFIALNFATIPAARLPEMVAQVRRGLAWAHRNARSFGGDPARIHVSGHSSGAHLVAAALTTQAPEFAGAPGGIVKGALCASGIYDLEPVLLSHRGDYLKLDAREARDLSPIRNLDRLSAPIIVAHGGKESAEFQRQATSFADAAETAGRLGGRIFAAGDNHFEISRTLAQPDGCLAAAALRQMGLEAPAS